MGKNLTQYSSIPAFPFSNGFPHYSNIPMFHHSTSILEDQHRIAVTIESIFFLNGLLISFH